ncbi:MAG TPA: hypothetical protein VFT45_17920 [Longimicrobium sp.]|nr:hypothetical protein [Longimicrobium sp.]
MSAARNLAALRAELEHRFGSAILPAPGSDRAVEPCGFRVGLRAVDRLLPHGISRPALSLWSGPATSGRTAALRLLVTQAVADGAFVALVDATRTLDAADWCVGASAGLWVARPPDPGHTSEGSWVAEHLLRTGVFGLVVLDGGPPPAPVDAHRLRSLAREVGAAIVVSTDEGAAGWRADVHVEFRRVPGAGPGLQVGGRFRRRAVVCIPKSHARAGDGAIEIVHEPRNVLQSGSAAPDRRRQQRGE